MPQEPGINLHPTLGVNARMVRCRFCGGETNELALLGTSNTFWRGENGQQFLGDQKSAKKFFKRGLFVKERDLEDGESVQLGVCDSCKKKQADADTVVKNGGIYWMCEDCSARGVIAADDDLAKSVRKKTGIKAPQPVGVKIPKKECPVCGPNAPRKG